MTLRAYADAGYAEVERARRYGEVGLSLDLLAFLMNRLDLGTCAYDGRCASPGVNATGRCRQHNRAASTERYLASRYGRRSA
jgi:hypothetical protein